MPLSKIDSDSLSAPLTVPAGSAAAPAITTTGDTNTGIFFPAADTIAFAEGGAEVMRITSAGNVGIADTAPNYKFNVGAAAGVTSLAGAGISLFTSGGLTSNIGGVLNFRPSIGTTASDIFNLSICAYDHSGDTNADGLSINGSDGVSFCTGSNSRQERARIASDGAFLIGKTTVDDTTEGFIYRASKYLNLVRDGNPPLNLTRLSSDGELAQFRRSTTQVGNISVTTSNTAYNTSSDYRLKEDIVPMTGALAKVVALNPCTYKWKIDGSDGQGFIAHELDEVVPGCVTGEKDAVDENGDIKPQGIDTSFLVATLTAAIQELKAIVDAQGAEIAALKGTP